ncbi:MAG: hypothetical protein JNK63_02850 [Chthonomonas sp.]|nr:hypothetical protein [Chthonomonas sp.]
MSVTKAEYRDLQRRYVGPDWPADHGETIEVEAVAQLMGVPTDEVVQDLDQLRLQAASVPDTLAAHAGYTGEPPMSGRKAIVAMAIMVAFCMVLFVLLMASIQYFVPKDRNFNAPPEQKSGEVLIQPK